ncbi:hypothetical protein LCGC14_2710110 [marine sediment metagenome]|uniref:Uncharacterized protein n=1 Tax=marine sediment metagenome TaxID=412755 RepID=A0A0F9BM63_9ZZZZ
MDLEFIYNISFWIKFVLIYSAFVITPVFFMNFTGSMGFGTKILFLVGGAAGVMIALNGKTIKYGKNRR